MSPLSMYIQACGLLFAACPICFNTAAFDLAAAPGQMSNGAYELKLGNMEAALWALNFSWLF